MKQFDILKIFESVEDETYCLIKRSNIFPDYKIGSDFDIFCYNALSFSEKISGYFNQHINKKISLNLNKYENKIVVDVIQENKINLRFDIYFKLPNFKNINVRDALFSSIIENNQKITFGDLKIPVPSYLDDAIIRYLEYHEWFSIRPDKIKHVNIIEEYCVEKKIDKVLFLNKLHYYLKFPLQLDSRRVSQNSFLRKLGRFLRKFKTANNYRKKYGLKKTLKLTFQKFNLIK